MPSADPGDAAARTRLGRQRSALALAVVAALLIHEGRVLGAAAGLLVGAFAAAAWGRRVSPRALTAATVLAALAAMAVTVGL
jgi:hypothetical protein